MRCQRCGFELTPGQTFCSMCGTEQSRALKDKKWKFKPKSFLFLIKVANKGHFFMWLAVAIGVISDIIIASSPVRGENGFSIDSSALKFSMLLINSLLVAVNLFYALMPYKNPNTSKTKAYKLRYRFFFVWYVVILFVTFFLDWTVITTTISDLLLKIK